MTSSKVHGPRSAWRCILGLVGVLLFAACSTDGDQVVSPDTCGAGAFSGFLGQNIASVALAEALNHRIIRPGDAVTRDYSLDRINFYLDENNTITRIICG
ncbi:MAG: I78 family peptidase inhibitor [Pseudomonadota bacterium]